MTKQDPTPNCMESEIPKRFPKGHTLGPLTTMVIQKCFLCSRHGAPGTVVPKHDQEGRLS